MLLRDLLSQWLVNYLKGFSYEVNPGIDFSELFRYYLSVKKRVPATKPRQVFLSKELRDMVIPTPFNDFLKILERKIEAGEDISYALSKNAANPVTNDLLLWDWGIHHLHLIDPAQPKSRSDFLLFAIFNETEVGFIAVGNHNDPNNFSDHQLIDIITRNWPRALEPFELKGQKPGTLKFSSEERRKLRKNGLSLMLEVNGKVYAPPGGGYSGRGSNFEHIIESDRYESYLELIQENAAADPDFIVNFLHPEKISEKYGKLEIKEIYPNLVLYSQKTDIDYNLIL